LKEFYFFVEMGVDNDLYVERKFILERAKVFLEFNIACFLVAILDYAPPRIHIRVKTMYIAH